jgi:hypothetical protein
MGKGQDERPKPCKLHENDDDDDDDDDDEKTPSTLTRQSRETIRIHRKTKVYCSTPNSEEQSEESVKDREREREKIRLIQTVHTVYTSR